MKRQTIMVIKKTIKIIQKSVGGDLKDNKNYSKTSMW